MISDHTSLSRLKPDVGLQPKCSASTQWELVSEQSVLQDETRPWTVTLPKVKKILGAAGSSGKGTVCVQQTVVVNKMFELDNYEAGSVSPTHTEHSD